MKKLLLLFTAVGILAFTFTSCESGEDRLSEEEINAKVDSIYEVEAAKLTEEMTLQCDQRIDSELMMKADQLVVAATATEGTGDVTGTTLGDEGLDEMEEEADAVDAMEPATADEEEEISDDQKIRMRVDEKLATLRKELELNCDEQLMAAARMRADSIINAKGLEATLPATPKKKTTTGTTTGKTEQPTNAKQSKMEGNQQSTTEDKKKKMEGGTTTEDKKKKMEGNGN